jgi:hypothetical protein
MSKTAMAKEAAEKAMTAECDQTGYLLGFASSQLLNAPANM